MYPILFEIGDTAVYSYGFMIALGAMAGVAYLAVRGKREVGLTFDQANTLFLLIFIAAFVGGKAFLFLEDAGFYIQHPRELLTGRGFVFYGSFLFAVPTMLWFFKRQHLPTFAMLDIMAVTTCLVHMFGRIGCFLAGCCYGESTDSIFGVTYTDAKCQASPLGTPLHPTQLYESAYIFAVMLILLWLRGRKKFYGQLFLVYLMLYAAGRFVLEYFRGDLARGFVIDKYLSHSQLIALIILAVVAAIYVRLSIRNRVEAGKPLI
ncbi:prolipoprotein diacylglyceryl transferase [Chryseolinea lacunae]|uniref:Phosphatidylglycerol--prolipoprotein diacylglyceryl transferase n=1 Tax=Chryseolinea lacunae TaxID=2801331 RepID=A0ABS1KWU9_9BACT|nr:prolipoprotein diacylglyceryl transferase [Chryseolinea lacunae]MBL0743810.1 prolipoprotein diacylglyceryl transferase [Chryseolinea lacunae]